MEYINEIRKAFLKIVTLSLTPRQIEHIGQEVDGNFNMYRESGFLESLPIPRQTAAETLLNYFKREEDIINLFEVMLKHENTKLRENQLKIQKKEYFIGILKKHKWIYDEYLMQIYRDPFYENEITFLKSLRMIDLRKNIPHKQIISQIKKISKELGGKNLNWKITIRLIEMNSENINLIKEAIELLLGTQNLTFLASDIFFCLRELANNASKANYKVIFQKYIAPSRNVDPHKNHKKFIHTFKNEISSNGTKKLLQLAKSEDIFFNIFLQSTIDSISIWISNYYSISEIEKQRIYSKLKNKSANILGLFGNDEYAEGAGMGVNIVKQILNQYILDDEPIKLFFYPDFFKIGFTLKRSDLKR